MIVSNDHANANAIAARLGRGVVTVVPVTSNTDRIFPFHTLLPAAVTGLRRDSKAQAEQVRSIPVERLGAVSDKRPRTSWRSSMTHSASTCSCSHPAVPQDDPLLTPETSQG